MNDFFGAIKSPDKYTDPGPSKDPAEGLGVLVYKLRVSLTTGDETCLELVGRFPTCTRIANLGDVLADVVHEEIVHNHEIRHQRTSTHQPTLHGTFAKLRICRTRNAFFCRYGGALCRE